MGQQQHQGDLIYADLSDFLRTIALWLFFVLSLFITYIIADVVHEAGHACACIGLRGNVGGFSHWLRGALTIQPSTDCSIKPFPPIVWAAGPLTSIVAWFASALVVLPLLNHSVVERGICSAIVWGRWSFWYLSPLFDEVRHTYARQSVWEDTTQFVKATGINPNLVGIPLATVLVISLWVWWRIQYRLLS
jgi:hypothetical protein